MSHPDDDPPRNDGGSCPACGGTDIRTKFASDPDPRMRIEYCLDCLMGTTGAGGIIDAMLFQSCQEQRQRKRQVVAKLEGAREHR